VAARICGALITKLSLGTFNANNKAYCDGAAALRPRGAHLKLGAPDSVFQVKWSANGR
jgi:hypothetical protein